MSHYTVAVIHRKDQNIAELLKPYDENLEVEPYIEYTKAEAIKYGHENFRPGLTDDQIYKIMCDGRTTDENGNIYTTYNPKSKWDWYQVGGRFKDAIRTKTGNRTDEAAIKDIDMALDEDIYKDALDFWDCEIAKTKERTPGKDYFTLYNEKYYKDYYGDRETYAKARASFYTYAVITPDGEWHAEGEMGWFGCSSSTPDDTKDWHENWQKRWLDDQDQDLIMTIVDCHI